MDSLFLSLSVKLKDVNHVGWYVQAITDAHHVIEPTTITNEGAEAIARAFDEALRLSDGELPQVPAVQLVNSASLLIRSALEEQLQQAEEWAAKIGPLRRQLATLPK